MHDIENQKFCQSCAMPMTDDELFATNADGSKNEDYCIYCFKDGEFTSDRSMDEMMNFCIDKMCECHPEIDKAEAGARMNEVFPKLKRWAND
ncbi:zinc ribbon domain-containing protein [Methanobrevibacter sp.]|uniref:zinc ribbon domain-containing protein n=1 Tax=Methanobrevibacter sp. TaxID=66852 RepID=UPI0025FDAA89|nr:zinc ribbon domain-containing protein [Methanobrevibacter sp.]MBR4447169.1 zinc ribbon domain-containing protein [Methanobrevibacter sp.]